MQTNAVGSTWLQGMLSSHPDIAMEGEYPRQEWSVTQIYRSLLFQLRRRGRKDAWGYKVKLGVMRGAHRDAGHFYRIDRWAEFARMLRCADARLICLYRRNWVKHAVSRARQQTQSRLCKTW